MIDREAVKLHLCKLTFMNIVKCLLVFMNLHENITTAGVLNLVEVSKSWFYYSVSVLCLCCCSSLDLTSAVHMLLEVFIVIYPVETSMYCYMHLHSTGFKPIPSIANSNISSSLISDWPPDLVYSPGHSQLSCCTQHS